MLQPLAPLPLVLLRFDCVPWCANDHTFVALVVDVYRWHALQSVMLVFWCVDVNDSSFLPVTFVVWLN